MTRVVVSCYISELVGHACDAHNMAQARRASDTCVFMLMGKIVEHTETARMFVTPEDSRTADYIEGKYG